MGALRFIRIHQFIDNGVNGGCRRRVATRSIREPPFPVKTLFSFHALGKLVFFM
jgi:hypothetical protein